VSTKPNSDVNVVVLSGRSTQVPKKSSPNERKPRNGDMEEYVPEETFFFF
jgi:hypothetical protein